MSIDIRKMRAGMRLIVEGAGASEQEIYLLLEDKLFNRVSAAIEPVTTRQEEVAGVVVRIGFAAIELDGVPMLKLSAAFK